MTRLQFQPVSFSWVALHPAPRGVIQFIGGAFFGTFPTLFYRHLLHELYQAGYTLVALPFRFSLRHWQIAYSLLDEQQRLRQSLPALAARQGYEAAPYLADANYQWLGHSLGCKYIALLELLRGDEAVVAAALPAQLAATYRHTQGSTLIAPDISDLASAIPLRSLVALLNRLNIGVQPDRQQTLALIRQSKLFNLTAMLSFDRDEIAGSQRDTDANVSDVLWLSQYLHTKSAPLQELSGKHLELLGWRMGRYIADFNPLDKFIKPLRQWQVAAVAQQFVLTLRKTATGQHQRSSSAQLIDLTNPPAVSSETSATATRVGSFERSGDR